MTGNNANNWQQIVINWGISPETASHFALRFNGHGGLVYPTLPGHRSRVLTLQPAADQPKNFWDRRTAHLPMPPLFNIPALDLPESLPRVYIANGEKSTMAMHTAGIPNTVNTFGEQIKIQEASELLAEHHVSEIFIAPDCDRTGLISARKWQQIAGENGIRVDLRDLRILFEDIFHLTPEQYRGFDLRDVWLRSGQNRKLFYTILQNLPPLDFARYADELPASIPKTRHIYTPVQKKTTATSDSIDWTAEYYNWRADVIAALDRVSTPTRKYHRTCPNPHHADRHPSFRITPEGAPVCTCEPSISWNMLAGWLNFPSWEERKQELVIADSNARIHTITDQPERLCYFPQGIPDTLREQILKLHKGSYIHDHASALVVYELWHIAILSHTWQQENPVTVERLIQYAKEVTRDTTEKTIRKGLAQLTSLGFFAETDPIQPERGRSIKQYQAQPLKTILPQFIEHLRYRLRESLFKDRIPDTVTPDWFEGQSAETAEALAAAENKNRTELYKFTEKEREQKEHQYFTQIKAFTLRFDFGQLLLASSSALLSDRTWHTGRQYRDAYYKVKAMQRITDDSAISRKKAAEQIGVSGRTLAIVRARENITTDEQFITLEIKDTGEVKRKIDQAAYWAVNHRYGRFLESSSGEKIPVSPIDTNESIAPWIEKQIEQGHTVLAKIQTSSKERLATNIEAEKMRAWLEWVKQQRSNPSSSRHPLPPPEETSQRQLTIRYRTAQLMLGGRRMIEAYAMLCLQGIPEDLFPFLTDIKGLSPDNGGKKGNKSDSEPPPEDEPPPQLSFW